MMLQVMLLLLVIPLADETSLIATKTGGVVCVFAKLMVGRAVLLDGV